MRSIRNRSGPARYPSQPRPHVDRSSCPWLIRSFIDPQAEFVFVEPNADPAALDRHTFDMRRAEYSHEGDKSAFQVLVARHGLESSAALVELGRIDRDADVPPSRTRRPESAGLDAFIRGVQLSVPDDDEKLLLVRPLYDALYAYCQGPGSAAAPGRSTSATAVQPTGGKTYRG